MCSALFVTDIIGSLTGQGSGSECCPSSTEVARNQYDLNQLASVWCQSRRSNGLRV